jgi:hypothetical protein
MARATAAAYLQAMSVEQGPPITIALLPPRWLRFAQRGLVALLSVHGGVLLWTGHPSAAGAAGLAVALAAWRPWTSRRHGACTFLKLEHGRFSFCDARGERPVRLLPSSRRLGMHLLLVLQAPGSIHRVLLGPGNVPARDLAALLRHLPSGSDAVTALHCQPLASRESDRPP